MPLSLTAGSTVTYPALKLVPYKYPQLREESNYMMTTQTLHNQCCHNLPLVEHVKGQFLVVPRHRSEIGFRV